MLKTFTFSKQKPEVDFKDERELNKHARDGYTEFDIDFIKISNVHDLCKLEIKIITSDKRLILPVYKHRFELLFEGGDYYLNCNTGNMSELKKLSFQTLNLMSVELEESEDEFEITFYCTAFTKDWQKTQYL